MGSTTSDDILGKVALDPLGNLLGTVVKLHLDNETKEVLGVTIDQGFVKPDLFVGIDHVRRFGIDAVMLNSMPFHLLKGKRVLSFKGEVLGTVVRVNADEGLLQSLVVSKKSGAFKKEEVVVEARDVKETGETIILRRRAE